VEIDHVLIAVADLSTAAQEMAKRDGLTSVEGGRRTGWGTANGIVPLGKTYLELVAVVDAAEARRSRRDQAAGFGEGSPEPPRRRLLNNHSADLVTPGR